jgi:hypothetical protein
MFTNDNRIATKIFIATTVITPLLWYFRKKSYDLPEETADNLSQSATTNNSLKPVASLDSFNHLHYRMNRGGSIDSNDLTRSKFHKKYYKKG